jgi:hypothetical protein
MDGPIPTSTLLAAPDWDETYEVDVLLAKANGYGIADIVTNYNSVNDRPAARPRTGWTTGFFGHHEPPYTEAQRLRPALMIKGDTLDVSIPRAELPSLSTPLRWGIETGNSFLSPDGNEFDATYDCPTSFTWGGDWDQPDSEGRRDPSLAPQHRRAASNSKTLRSPSHEARFGGAWHTSKSARSGSSTFGADESAFEPRARAGTADPGSCYSL